MNVIRPVGQTAVSALFIAGLFLAGLWFSVEHLSAQSPATTALPLLNGAHPSALPLNAGIAPEVGCWFMSDREAFREEGYRWYMDNIASRSTFELFSASTRYDLEVTDPRFHDLMKEAATYAADRYGVGILLDLDIRLARRAFAEKYPHALQERLFLQEQPVRDSAVALSYEAVALEDHYTGNSVPYRVLGNRFVKAWTYVKNEKGEIVPNTLRDISREVAMASDDAGQAVLRVSLPDAGARAASQRRFVCGIVAFSYLYPDLFAPELQSFEKEILYQYRDVPLKGICKDEWGFPPDFTGNRDKDRYWYSETMRKAYAEKHPGRVLADDAFLMYLPQEGMEREREQVIDRYNRLCFEQQVRIETAYVEAGREVFGVDVFPATHPTWWPWPDSREFTKNQLSWWKVPRTYAQTDECVPYFCRTSLAKGTNTVWYNMFYAPSTDAYVAEHWGAALAGGRVNIHPLYPAPKGDKSGMVDRMREILDTGIDEARHKIRLLDLITRSPVDAPVAVVFGHWGAMNWARPE
ncbi:MAG: hypothetical protein LBT76_04335, partial [Tannerella sp.]|nr:hypothetical protein [Tannerella sp.]